MTLIYKYANSSFMLMQSSGIHFTMFYSKNKYKLQNIQKKLKRYIYTLPDVILHSLLIFYLQHSRDISCSLLVNLSHTDESWVGGIMCLWI